MLRYALLRILGAIPTILLVIAIAFLMVHAAPGGPFDEERMLPPEIERNVERAYHLDEPFGDPSALPTYYVCREAVKYVKVCLSGDGGDELFAGYRSYLGEYWYRRYMLIPVMFQSLFQYLYLWWSVLFPSRCYHY